MEVLLEKSLGMLPIISPPLLPEEKLILLGPPVVFWLCVWFWAAIVFAFPSHAAAHELKGHKLKSPSLKWVCFYTISYQLIMVLFQYSIWSAGKGRAPPVEGGFSNIAEWKACAVQLVPALLLMDFYYYWCHRFLHLPLPYRYVHKMHHTVHVPYASAAFYLHPVEALILDHGAAFVASTLFPGMRFWVVVFIQLMLPVRASHEHMGYTFPWDVDNSRVGTKKASHHGIHHLPKGHKYNYATPFFTFTDDLFGTRYPGDEKMKALRAERERKTE